MSIRVFSYRFFTHITSTPLPSLIGNEVIYSEELAEPLIKTFSCDSMIPFYFTIEYYYLQPKYTTSVNQFGLCIIVSDELFDRYFKHDLFDLLPFTITYQIHVVDIITLKRVDGDFPQDGSIDELLTLYLESCSIVNKYQLFTIPFYGNQQPFKNHVTFEISDFTTHPYEELENTFQETLNTNLHDLGITVVVHKASDLVGLVANHEIKVDFMPEPVKEKPIYTLPEVQRAKPVVDTPETKSEGLHMTDSIHIPLTKDQLRQARLQKFS